MTVPARVSLVTIGVRDLTRSTAFYEALGWRRSSASTDGVSFFHTSGPVVSLYPHELLAADAGVQPHETTTFSGITLAMNVSTEAEVDRILAEAEAAGGHITKRAEKAFWGGYSGYFADPDETLWEVAHNPHFPLDDDGRITLPE